MITDINTLKDWFRNRLKPTQEQFWAWMDSYWHKSEKIPADSVENLTTILNNKAEKSQFEAHLTDAGAHSNVINQINNEISVINGEIDVIYNEIAIIKDGLTVDLSGLSIISTTNIEGVTTLRQQDETKAILSKIGQSGDINDIITDNLPYCIDNTAALQIGLQIGKPYATPTGDLRIVVPKGFVDVFRNAVVRNTSLDNYNVTGEVRFKIASVIDANTITVDQDIPDIVMNGVEAFKTDKSQNRKWMLMRDYGSACLINSIDNDKRTIRHAGIAASVVGQYTVGSYVQFFNPFINYSMPSDNPLVATVPGTWLNTYACIAGIWQTRAGTYRGVLLGLNGKIRMGLVESTDLLVWNKLNNGNYMYEPGTGIFNNPITSTTAIVYSNPIKIGDNLYLNFLSMGNGGTGATNNGVGWIKHDEDFNIVETNFTPISLSNYPNYIQYSGGAVLFNGKYYVYITDRMNSTYHDWRIIEAVINPVNMQVESSQVVHTSSNLDTFDSMGIDLVTPFVYNNSIYLFVYGTGATTYNDSIYNNNREIGLKTRAADGTFSMNSKSPVILNPINGNYTWGAGLSACNDHVGGIAGLHVKNGVLYYIASMNSMSNAYVSYLLKINLA